MSDPLSNADTPENELVRHIPPALFLRYILLSSWNTIFGYVCFFVVNFWLSKAVPSFSYLVAYFTSTLINITVSFLGYKWFVFRTKGNYLREWLRTFTIYSGSIAFSTLALAPLVGLIRHTTRYQTQAPYIAGALLAIVTVVSSFVGHRNFSFRAKSPLNDESGAPGIHPR